MWSWSAVTKCWFAVLRSDTSLHAESDRVQILDPQVLNVAWRVVKSSRALPWVHLKKGSSQYAYCGSARYKILILEPKTPLSITDQLPVLMMEEYKWWKNIEKIAQHIKFVQWIVKKNTHCIWVWRLCWWEHHLGNWVRYKQLNLSKVKTQMNFNQSVFSSLIWNPSYDTTCVHILCDVQ